ncbi:hypothetical protein ACFQ0K_17465 [Nocardioides caeni]|uniref:WD40 repeat domain-containing protein n=1 Tax=Nocardioides caeni TaxID=574700 RepID=A0A4S8NGX9_9ACTN|nr:hypothetical protein [Nocardioides caeni]THV15898.1 hypothetical protein E9934_06060 [Nocardioides caeni]
MNDLERDLSGMFADRATAVEVPPLPDVLRDPTSTGRRSRRAVVVALVAAAVAAVAIPLAVVARDDEGRRPTERPTVVPDEDRRPALELPYLSGGVLHVGDVSVPTDATGVIAGGDEVYVVTVDDRGAEHWSRLVGDELEPVSWLDDVLSAEVSDDGRLIASVTGPVSGDTIEIHETVTGRLVDRFAVEEPVWEVQVLAGWDRAGRLFWHDGAAPRIWRSDTGAATWSTGGLVWAGMAPSGPILWDGETERSTVVAVEADGTTSPVAQVPVSGTAAWSADGRIAYVDDAASAIFVEDLTTGRRTRLDVTAADQLLGWSGPLVVVREGHFDGEVDQPGEGDPIITIDPTTGERQVIGELGAEDGGFPGLGGTGTL